ncbi:DUF2628 domain-containing protein [Kumtagia ephedrae]|uniref:DUF2628 domain-containing protein n=1 Tax=Kumtagia ephedrae TaxID=2116701 RepID=A0A2P7S1N1_9HYPH|nr:DUF2628 domain-containing protein [Mesorhizobium ephedrae]PSJ56362.1 DUF2628 domain-containing protein [Mesorhizobium ephedrae]
MARFVIFEPDGALGSDAVAEARIVRDGFAVLGFLVPPLWLLWHGLVIEAVLVFATMFGIGAVGELLGLGPAGSALSLLVSVYVGLEGAALRMAALRRRGWREWGAVEADRIADAEIRYATEAVGAASLPHDHVASPPEPRPARHAAPRPSTGPALGLLHYPGGA